MEKVICSENQLSDLDDQLSQSYKNAMANTMDQSSLKAEQRAWLTNVRNKCQDSLCIRRVYKERIAALNNSPAASNISGGTITGLYKYKEKGFYGDMTVSEVSSCTLFPKALGCLSTQVLTAKINSINSTNAHDCEMDLIENPAARITNASNTEVAFVSKDKSQNIDITVIFNPKGADISGDAFNGCGLRGSILGHWKREVLKK